MGYFFLLITLLLYSILTNAQTDTDTSVTKTTWFWPLLGICIALLLSIPCTLIIIGIIYHIKHKSDDDDSDESSITSNSSSSTTPVQPETRHRHIHHHRSHYAGAFRSPPPPYTTNELPKNIFLTPSLPPPYDSHTNSDGPTTTTNPLHDASVQPPTLDISSTLTSPSIQTFQA